MCRGLVDPSGLASLLLFYEDLNISNGRLLKFQAHGGPVSHLTPPFSSCRITGFKLSLGSSGLLLLLAALGVANRFLDEYLDFHVTKKLRHSS